MENAKMIKYPDMKVALRKDFYGLFRKVLKDFFEESGCIYFGQNVIKNYRKKGHVVSTFSNDEKWHELYWDKYYNTDPLEKMVNGKASDHSFSLMSLNLAPTSECLEDRLRLCDIKEGFALAINHNKEITEFLLFGWKNFNMSGFTIEKISKLSNILKPIRNFHLEKGLEVFNVANH
jgi:hypothetical protein